MPYYFECPACGNIHDIQQPGADCNPMGLPDRRCDTCGDEGCVDCIADECGECRAEIDYDDQEPEWSDWDI